MGVFLFNFIQARDCLSKSVFPKPFLGLFICKTEQYSRAEQFQWRDLNQPAFHSAACGWDLTIKPKLSGDEYKFLNATVKHPLRHQYLTEHQVLQSLTQNQNVGSLIQNYKSSRQKSTTTNSGIFWPSPGKQPVEHLLKHHRYSHCL